MDPFWEGLGDGFRSFLEDFWWFLGLQEGIQDNPDFEGVLASIFGRFFKGNERQKIGFRIRGVHFLRTSGVAR